MYNKERDFTILYFCLDQVHNGSSVFFAVMKLRLDTSKEKLLLHKLQQNQLENKTEILTKRASVRPFEQRNAESRECGKL